MKKCKLFIMTLAGVILVSSMVFARPVQVVTTIKPLHSLLSALMLDIAKPKLLIPDATPYEYIPTPQDLHLVKDADLIVWMGPELEQSLTSVLHSTNKNLNVFEMLSDSEFKVLEKRGEENKRDPFMWLDVRNGEVFVDALYDQLVAIDPSHQEKYTANRDALKQKVSHLDRMFEFGFRGVPAGVSWLYHDTQQYFEQSYAFKVRGVLSLLPGEVADTMNLLKARTQISTVPKVCFFVEEGMTQARSSIALEGTNAQVVSLDSFGLGYPAGPELYIQIMQHNYDAIRGCFKKIRARFVEKS